MTSTTVWQLSRYIHEARSTNVNRAWHDKKNVHRLCLFILQAGDVDALDRTAGAIRGRSTRICGVVSAEMDNYEPGYYTGRVMEAVKLLSERVMPNFAEKVEAHVQLLSMSGFEASACQEDQNELENKPRC